jgi:hypothetical protein
MTKEQAKEIIVQSTAELKESDLHLTDEQIAEVRRRRGKQNPNYISLTDARRSFGVQLR